MSVEHIAAMKSHLISQFRELPTLGAFIDALGQQLNDVEEFFGQLLTNLSIQTLAGPHLDKLGDMLQQSRNGMSDDDYRTMLQARVVAYRSQGTIENLIQILLTIAGAQAVQVVEEATPPNYYPTLAIAASACSASVILADVYSAVYQAKPAGVGLALSITSASLPVFQFDAAATGNNDGFDIGHLAGLIN